MHEYGILSDMDEVKLLILYAMKSLAQPVVFDDLNEVMMLGGNVTYFDEAAAFEELLQSGHIDRKMADEKAYYNLTRLGEEALSLLDRRLSFTVRERTMKNAMKVLARIKYDSQISANVLQSEKGCIANMKIIEDNDTLFELNILVANKMQANSVCKTFRKNVETVYQTVIELLTQDTDKQE